MQPNQKDADQNKKAENPSLKIKLNPSQLFKSKPTKTIPMKSDLQIKIPVPHLIPKNKKNESKITPIQIHIENPKLHDEKNENSEAISNLKTNQSKVTPSSFEKTSITPPIFSRLRESHPWLDEHDISNFETYHCPEFFTERSANKTSLIFLKIRNFIIKAYHKDPDSRLTFSAVRRHLQGDVGALRRIFKFLERQKLINYSAPVFSQPKDSAPRIQFSQSIAFPDFQKWDINKKKGILLKLLLKSLYGYLEDMCFDKKDLCEICEKKAGLRCMVRVNQIGLQTQRIHFFDSFQFYKILILYYTIM